MIRQAPEVVGLGQCALDILGTLERFPAVDSKCELADVQIQGGGPVATALVTLAHLGTACAFVGRIGSDDFGRRIRDGLLTDGVDCRYLSIDDGKSSQFSFVAVEGDRGLRTIFCHRGSARPLTADELPEEAISQCRLLHLDGTHIEAAIAAARLARRSGVVTVLDGGSWRSGIDKLLPLIDHAVVSARFAAQLTPKEPLRQVLPLLIEGGCQAATVTDGEQGSWTLKADGSSFQQPAFAVAAVDTTGCGDVFHGGYLYGLLQAWPLRRTVRFAAACAALKTRALGGRTGIPTLKEVEMLLAVENNQ